MRKDQPTRRRGGWRRRAAVWVGSIAIGVGFAAGVMQIGFWVIRPVAIHRHAEVERFDDPTPLRSAHGVLLFPATDDVAIYNESGRRVGTLSRPVIDHGPIEASNAIASDEVGIEVVTADWEFGRGLPSVQRVRRDAMVFLLDQPRRDVMLAMIDERGDESWGDAGRGEYGICRARFSAKPDGRMAVRVDFYDGCGCFG